jgi:hypothetical protein
MKIKMIFNLPDDQIEYDMANKASAMYSFIWDVKQEIRTELKYNSLTDEQYEIMDKFSEFFHEKLIEYSINLNI